MRLALVREPKPAAAVLLEREGDGAAEPSVLLLKRAIEPGLGLDLPAGYLDPGESFEMAARRRRSRSPASRSS